MDEDRARELYRLLFEKEHVNRRDAKERLGCTEEEFQRALDLLKRRIQAGDWRLPTPDPTPILERPLSKRARQMMAYG